MHFRTVIALSLPVMGAFAAPRPQTDCMSPASYGDDPSCSSSLAFGVTTTTLSQTLTVTSTHTYTATATATAAESSSTSSSAPVSTPTAPYGIISARSGSSVHLLPWTAAHLRLYLGGTTASYCPDSVNETENCPSGTSTGFRGICSMDVEVPGGQIVYVSPSGEIGYTQAHSFQVPPGSNTCPFTFTKSGGSAFGFIGLSPELAFGATSFMGCPTDEGPYQVFASLQNATVPQGNVSDCVGFDAIAEEYGGDSGNNEFAAWEYI